MNHGSRIKKKNCQTGKTWRTRQVTQLHRTKAAVDSSGCWTYRQLFDAARRIAALLATRVDAEKRLNEVPQRGVMATTLLKSKLLDWIFAFLCFRRLIYNSSVSTSLISEQEETFSYFRPVEGDDRAICPIDTVDGRNPAPPGMYKTL